jgi:DNA-binding response OmpR family regulator
MNSQPHILIIEDDLAVAESLAAALERERFIVTHKETGRDGMNYAKESYPHLILLDLRLPDGSGFDFAVKCVRQVSTSLF